MIMILPAQTNSEKKGVIVAIDVDNLLMSFDEAGEFGPGYKKAIRKKPKDLSWLRGFSIRAGFENAFEWIKTFGEILCVHFYMPYTQYTNDSIWHAIWEKYNEGFPVEAIYCPRKVMDIRDIGKIKKSEEKLDNVDAHLIRHTERLMDLYGNRVGYFCLMSGDSDYRPLIWQLRKKEIKIAFVLGSEKSFSSVYRDIQIAGIHPATGEELVHYFAPRRSEKAT